MRLIITLPSQANGMGFVCVCMTIRYFEMNSWFLLFFFLKKNVTSKDQENKSCKAFTLGIGRATLVLRNFHGILRDWRPEALEGDQKLEWLLSHSAQWTGWSPALEWSTEGQWKEHTVAGPSAYRRGVQQKPLALYPKGLQPSEGESCFLCSLPDLPSLL